MKAATILDRIGRVIIAVLSGGTALAALALYTLTSSTMYAFIGIIAVVSTVFGLKAKSKWLITYIIGGFVLLLYIGFTGAFSGNKTFQYPFQKWYAHERGGFDVSFLPDELPDTVYSYSTDFQPSIMQGSGHYSVLVETDEKTVAEIKADAEKRAMEIIPLTACLDEYMTEEYIERGMGAFQYVYKDSDEKVFFVYIPIEALRNPDGYYVYVAYTDYDFNHPSTLAYIIDETTNTVIWSII